MFKKFDAPDGFNISEPQPQIKKEAQLSQEDLRKRYEDPYRDEMAQKLRAERNTLKEKDVERQKQIEGFLSVGVNVKAEVRDTELANVSSKIQAKEDVIRGLRQDVDSLNDKQKGRGFFDKIKYKFIADPIETSKKTVEETLKAHENARALLDAEIQTISSQYSSNVEGLVDQNQTLSNEQKEKLKEEKKKLLNRTREINSSSKEAIKETFLSLEQGDLDINKLAKESNALVVHAIPLDGWSAKNTSMNNSEIDTVGMLAQEKSDIIFNKRPDLSASIISAEDLIHGQEMFYPFAYILDGSVIASYEGDEGTITDGDVRRRKSEYHGTLQSDTIDNFRKIAKSPAAVSQGGQYNETIVHNPKVRGVLIDEQKISNREDLGEEQKKIFILDDTKGQEEYKDFLKSISHESIISENEGVAVSGENKGKNIKVVKVRRSPIDKAVDYASKYSPGVPVYLRKTDGIYTLQGEKVTASDIYK